MSTASDLSPGQPWPDIDQSWSARITTGIRHADLILGGGFPARTINVVMGQPGTGKTVFVEQVLFANASPERPVLYVTTLSEPLAKVVRFVQEFDFYDADKLGTAVLYEDVGAELAAEGVTALVPRLKEWIKEIRPGMIVIDSFRALHDISESIMDMRHLVHDLTALLTAYDTTSFLVGEYHEEDIRRYPEFAVADGVVELSRRGLGTRDERFFRVLKLRGSWYLEGAHAFRITKRGLDVFARLVTAREPAGYAAPAGRVASGVAGLDAILHGGMPSGSSTLVTGPSGSGKTTLALQFVLEGVRQGEPSVHLCFQENPTQLSRTIARLAGDTVTAADLSLIYSSPVELQIDRIVAELFDLVETQGVRRVSLDAVGDLVAATTDTRRLHDYIYALLQHLAANGVTSVLTLEAGGDVSSTMSMMSLTDNVLVLGLNGEGRSRRSIRVLKARGTAHHEDICGMSIEADGIHVT